MNPVAIWKTASATIDRGQRWLLAGFWLLMTIFAGGFLRHPNQTVIATMTYAFGLAFWWAVVVSRTLLLQKDLRRLRIGGADQTICVNLALQYLLSVMPFAVVVAVVFDGSFLRLSAFLTCVVIGAVLFQLLPRYLSMLLALSPSLLQALGPLSPIPGPSEASFGWFGWILALGLGLIAAQRWLGLLKVDADAFGRLNLPMLFSTRGVNSIGDGMANWDTNIALGSAPTSGLSERVSLHDAGPAKPVQALRVWMGGLFAPVTWQARVSQLSWQMASVAGIVVVGALSHGVLHRMAIGLLISLGIFSPLIMAAIVPARLKRLYADAGGEIALLAVLPGLGEPRAAKTKLLRATLGAYLSGQTALAVLVIGVAAVVGVGAWVLFAIALTTMVAMALSTALSMGLSGGRFLPGAAVAALGVVAVLLTVATQIVITWAPRDGSAGGGFGLDILVCWGFLSAILMVLTVRGWRGLKRRPHAFLLSGF